MPGLAGETANLIVALKLDDSGFSGKLNNAARQLRGMDRGLSQMGRGVGQIGSGLARLGERAALAAAGGLTAVVTTAISFEDAFAGVRKTVDASEEDLDALMGTLRGMAREIPISFEELSGIASQAGALGIAFGAIDEFTRTVALLGETTDVTTEEAATSLGVLANILKLREEDFDNFGSALVDLGNKGASTESQILGIAERAGAGASLIGVAADETLGWASAAANLGIEVEAGGSALQKFFLESLGNLQDDDTLATMAETAGMTSDAFVRAFEEDASDALASFVRGLGDLDEASRLNVLENLGFNDIRIQRLLLGLAGDADMLAETLAIANEAWDENNALQTEASKRFDTTRAKLDILLGNMRDVGFVIGNEIIPIVSDLSSELVDWINKPETQRGIKTFAEDLAGGIRGLVSEFKGTDFSGLIGGIKLAADVAKGAFEAFTKLPKEVQQLAIAALVANKVTGGAVGDIARGLGSLVLGSLKTITASHVTVIGGTVTGGPGAGPGGGGKGGPAGRGGGKLPLLGIGGALGIPLMMSGSDNPTAQQFVDRQRVERGEMTKEDYDRLWNHGVVSRTIEEIRTNGVTFGRTTPDMKSDAESADRVLLQKIQTEIATLPDTAMLAPAVAALTQNLPPIRSKADAALAAQYQALQAARGTQGEVGRLANTPHNVNVNNNVTIPVHVSATLIQNQLYRLRTTTGSGGFI